MAADKKTSIGDSPDKVITEAKRYQKQREQGYREQALKIFPWICARCGREFSGKKLQQLTVHHKDHNHDYNPADGSNWELLCIYCHEQEHTKYLEENQYGSDNAIAGNENPSSTFKPFANLESLFKTKKN
ncbi:MAG: YajD family HNH nuclease [Deltaproteobacteria bacterium]|nr:YajD family HNH nuclease [Deltaproteobacteria bacterium]